MSGPEVPGMVDVDLMTFKEMAQGRWFHPSCPDWRQEHLNSSDFTLLTNPVHPVFQQRTAGTFTRFDDQETLPARRFASRILEADCMIPFWWSLFFGSAYNDLFLDPDPALEARQARASEVPIFDFGGVSDVDEAIRAIEAVNRVRQEDVVIRLYDPDPGPLAADQVERTKAALLELASCVFYNAVPYPKQMACITAWNQRTPNSLPGAPSVIHVGGGALSQYSDLLKGDVVSQAWATITLGFKFVQQVAHAALAAGRSGAELNWSNQYDFRGRDAPGARIRMLESRSFGGALREDGDEPNGAQKSHYTIDNEERVPGLWYVYSDFPSAQLEEMCGPLIWGEDDRPEDQKGLCYYREWKLPFSWLLKVVSDDFWDEARGKGKMALRPPKKVGYVMCRDDERKSGPFHAAELRALIVPAGYSMVPRSYLMVSNELYHEACGAVLFGGFRVADIMPDNGQPPARNGSVVTDDTSISDGSREDEEDHVVSEDEW